MKTTKNYVLTLNPKQGVTISGKSALLKGAENVALMVYCR